MYVRIYMLAVAYVNCCLVPEEFSTSSKNYIETEFRIFDT